MGNNGWTKIDNAALCDARLTTADFRVLCGLLSFDWQCDFRGDGQQQRKGVVWPAQTTLAGKVGLGRRTVQRSLEHLETLGYIVRVAGSGGGQLRARGGKWYRNAYRLQQDRIDGAPS